MKISKNRHTDTKVNTKDTLSEFQKSFLQPINMDRFNTDIRIVWHPPFNVITLPRVYLERRQAGACVLTGTRIAYKLVFDIVCFVNRFVTVTATQASIVITED